MRGISTVIATILLLVMVVVITAGVFYFFKTTITTTQTTGQRQITGAVTETQIQASVKAVRWYNNSNYLFVTIYNGLDKEITVKEMLIGNNRATFADDNTVNPGSTKDFNTSVTYNTSLDGKKAVVVIEYGGKTYTLEFAISLE